MAREKSRVIVMRNTYHHIKVPGFRVGKDEEVVDSRFSMSPDFTHDRGSANEAATLLEWEAMRLRLSMEAYSSEGVPDAHWRTLTADRICQL